MTDPTPLPTPTPTPFTRNAPLSLEATIRELSKRAADRGEIVVDVVISRDEYAAAVRDNNVGEVLTWMIANPHAWEAS